MRIRIYALLRGPGVGGALNFSAGVLFIGGAGITRNHVRLPRRHFYGRAGIRVRRRKILLFLSRRRGGACVERRCDYLREGPPRGVPRIAYINPSGTCLPHVARQFAVFRGVK